MVYCGKPSRGCENCRKLHVKCDESRPECSQCTKMKRACLGYRDQLSLAFRDETERTQRKARKTRFNHCSTSPIYQPSVPIDRSDLLPISSDNRNLHEIDGFGKHLSPPLEDSVVCNFYETTAASLSDEDHTRYLHLLLPDLYNRSAPYSPLRLAAQAISYATSAKSRPDLAQRSRELYGQAISALSSAIRNPTQVKSDQTLYAVLLLSGHQTITCELGTPLAYGTHIDGAAALLRVRGKEQLCEPTSCHLFHYVRRSIVLSHMQISKPIHAIFYKHVEFTCLHETQEDRLIARTIDIPNLQSQANIVLSHSTWPENGQPALELLKTAKRLDSGISDWARSVPATWSYTIATDLDALSDTEGRVSDFSPPQIHRYPSFYIARIWNIYRVSRLIILSIILRVTARSPSNSTHGEQELDWIGAERRQRKLVNEICASVPFLLNHDLSRMALPIIKGQRESDEKSDIVTKTGRYSLIWPLYVGSSVTSIPDNQRRWMGAQLQRIGDSGEPQAKLLSDLQCQTLLGGPEKFRFYCV